MVTAYFYLREVKLRASRRFTAFTSRDTWRHLSYASGLVECGIRLWVLVTAGGMSDASESLLDVDKIKELSLLVARCGVNESRGLVDPLFELVGVTIGKLK